VVGGLSFWKKRSANKSEENGSGKRRKLSKEQIED